MRVQGWSRLRPWILWPLILAAVTGVLFESRFEIEQAHVVLIYLLVVLGGSIGGGRPLGLGLASAAFLLIDYYFQPPFDSLAIGKPLDLVILVSFFATAGAATQLLARAQAEATEARRRAEEVATLARIGSESLTAGRAEDALVAIGEVIRSTLRVSDCHIYRVENGRLMAGGPTAHGAGAAAASEGADLLGRVIAEQHALAVMPDGSVNLVGTLGSEGLKAADLSEARLLLLPLMVHTRLVGVLRVADPERLAVGLAEQRFLDALAYYAALGVERVRLVAEAEHAEALREADRLKDELLASVSHDLRTPLTAIKALAQEAGTGGNPAARAIEEQADRLGRMVADLLDLSRIKSGSLPVHSEENTAEDLVGAATTQLAGLLQGRELKVDIDLTQPALVGRFDFVQSLRVLCNLLENALRYSPPNMPVDLSVRREESFLRFRVADRGPGIAPTERERIFEPFYRPAGAPPDAGRAGLGLAIARRLAEAQGGGLRYEPRPGGGSVFVVDLPSINLPDDAQGESL